MFHSACHCEKAIRQKLEPCLSANAFINRIQCTFPFQYGINRRTVLFRILCQKLDDFAWADCGRVTSPTLLKSPQRVNKPIRDKHSYVTAYLNDLQNSREYDYLWCRISASKECLEALCEEIEKEFVEQFNAFFDLIKNPIHPNSLIRQLPRFISPDWTITLYEMLGYLNKWGSPENAAFANALKDKLNNSPIFNRLSVAMKNKAAKAYYSGSNLGCHISGGNNNKKPRRILYIK